MAQKIDRYSTFLFTVLVLSLGFGQLLRFEFYGVPLYLHDILVMTILAIQLPRSLLSRNSWLQAKKGEVATSRSLLVGIKLFLLGLSLGWLRALTLYPLHDLLVPSLYTFRLLAYLGLFIAVKQSKIRIPSSIFLFSGLVTLLIGLAQYVLLPDMRVFKYLGWDDHLNRLILPHFDPTFTAVMLGLFMLIFFQFNSIFDILVPLFSLGGILLTYSRSVWLSLALTFTFFMIKSKKLNYLIIGICLLIIPIFFLPKKFGEGTNLLRTYSIESRIASDYSYFHRYMADTILGRGTNTLLLDAPLTPTQNHASGPNNSYLYLLLTSGVFGLIGWGIFMYSLFIKSTHKPMLVFFFITSLFNNVMFYPFALLWVLLIESDIVS